MKSNGSVVRLALLTGLLFASLPQVSRCQQSTAMIEDLARRSDVVVVGKVTGVRSQWSADRSRIISTVTLSVDQHIKGDVTQNSVEISTPGGEVDGVGELYSHMARFKTDEQVIVFAVKDRQGQLRVADGDEGKLTVTKEVKTGRLVVGANEPLLLFTSRLKAIVQAQGQKQ